MPPEFQNQDAKLIQGEQKRLDLLDMKKDKKVDVGGKDFGKIIFEKTNELTKKINDDFGARDTRLTHSKEFQVLKKKGMNAIVTVLWNIDKKNIEVETRRLEAVIAALEKSGDSMRKLESYLQNGDALTDKMNNVDSNLEPLLKKIEEMRKNDDPEIIFLGQKIHKGDMIALRPDGYNKPIKQILIANIDTEGKTIRIQEVGSTSLQRRSYEDFANYVMALKGAYTRQFKGEEIHVSIQKRIIVEKTTNGELLQQEELAKQYLQEKAILAWEQRILDKNVGVNFDEDIKTNPACASFFSTNQLQLKGGKLAFSVEFSKKNTDTVHDRRMEALKALELYLDKKPLVEQEKKAVMEKNEGAKYIAQVELALHEGRLADARRSAISYIHFQQQHPENFIRTPKEEERIQKINAYLEKIQELAIQKLRSANNTTFGKSAYEAMKRRKVYSGDMSIYESAFSNVHARNAKILEQMATSKSETDLIRDPEEIFRTAQTAADPMHTPELREAIKNCERIWNKVAYAETRFMTKNPKGEEKTAYADAAEALRTLGETNNAESYLIAGMQDKIDIVKNADFGKKMKDKIILKLNAHREEYVKQVKSQFLRDHAWEDDAEIPEEIFNQLVDSAIERAADGELEKRIMRDIDFANDTGKLDTSADKRLATLHDRMLNPNDKFFAITDEELYDTGDKVIGLAGEALLIGLSGGVGGIASAGTRALLMRYGARKLLAHAGAVVVEAGAFELANKTLAPHITGGPGFTTGQEFMQDWGRSIIMFGALKGGGAYAQQLKALHVDQLAKTGKVLSKTAEFGHNAFALATEASAMTLSTEVQEIASGKSISEIDSLRLAADNLKMILELRLGGKLVAPITKPLHEYAKNIEEDTQRREAEKAIANPVASRKSPFQLFDFAIPNPEKLKTKKPEERPTPGVEDRSSPSSPHEPENINTFSQNNAGAMRHTAELRKEGKPGGELFESSLKRAKKIGEDYEVCKKDASRSNAESDYRLSNKVTMNILDHFESSMDVSIIEMYEKYIKPTTLDSAGKIRLLDVIMRTVTFRERTRNVMDAMKSEVQLRVDKDVEGEQSRVKIEQDVAKELVAGWVNAKKIIGTIDIYEVHGGLVVKFSNEKDYIRFSKRLSEATVHCLRPSESVSRVSNIDILDSIKDGDNYRLSESRPKVSETDNYSIRETPKEEGHENMGVNLEELAAELWPEGIKESNFKQGNAGNCWFLARLNSIKKHPLGKMMLARMIRKAGNNAWEVNMGEFGMIKIENSEIGGQKVFKLGKGSIFQEKRTLNEGSLGDKILIVAMGKCISQITGHKYWMDAVEGGKGKDKWHGKITEVLEMFLGDVAKYRISEEIKDDQSFISEKMGLLDRYSKDPHGFVLMASTRGKESDAKFLDPENRFYSFHAYSVESVDAAKREITVVNPWDTMNRKHTISYEDFGKYFGRVQGVELNSDRVNTAIDISRNAKQEAHDVFGESIIPGYNYNYTFESGERFTVGDVVIDRNKDIMTLTLPNAKKVLLEKGKMFESPGQEITFGLDGSLRIKITDQKKDISVIKAKLNEESGLDEVIGRIEKGKRYQYDLDEHKMLRVQVGDDATLNLRFYGGQLHYTIEVKGKIVDSGETKYILSVDRILELKGVENMRHFYIDIEGSGIIGVQASNYPSGGVQPKVEIATIEDI